MTFEEFFGTFIMCLFVLFNVAAWGMAMAGAIYALITFS